MIVRREMLALGALLTFAVSAGCAPAGQIQTSEGGSGSAAISTADPGVYGPFTLPANQPLVFGAQTLVLQGDGNLVALTGSTPVWASGTQMGCTKPGDCTVSFQSDGNLVLYKNGNAFWASNTGGHANLLLRLSTEAPFVQILKKSSKMFWSSCISGTDEDVINRALSSVGTAGLVNLCAGQVFQLAHAVTFTAPRQVLQTDGLPEDDTRAQLVIADTTRTLSLAVEGRGQAGIALRNVVVDGNRRNLGDVASGPGLISFGDTDDQVIDHVRAFDTRSWSTIYIENDQYSHRTQVTHNAVGPSGYPSSQPGDLNRYPWADGISLQSTDAEVSGNTITDATDGAIVIFGSPGAQVHDNTIVSQTRTLLGGINMVDEGDFSGVVVDRNTIRGDGGFVKVGIAMGAAVWGFSGKPDNQNAVVTNNTLTGSMGYGLAVNGVQNFTIQGNQLSGTYTGHAGSSTCAKNPGSQAYVITTAHATGSFQAGFTDGDIEDAICVSP